MLTVSLCVFWYCSQDYFHDRIAQLTFTFPEDAVTSTGLPFWSAPKRFPRPVRFDAADPAHTSFVQVRCSVCLGGGGCWERGITTCVHH